VECKTPHSVLTPSSTQHLSGGTRNQKNSHSSAAKKKRSCSVTCARHSMADRRTRPYLYRQIEYYDRLSASDKTRTKTQADDSLAIAEMARVFLVNVTKMAATPMVENPTLDVNTVGLYGTTTLRCPSLNPVRGRYQIWVVHGLGSPMGWVGLGWVNYSKSTKNLKGLR